MHAQPPCAGRRWLALAFLVLASSALADERCASRKDDWTCFGMMQIQPDPSGPSWRMRKFSNDEFLAQIELGSTTKSFLLAQPSGVRLYHGLSAQDSALSSKDNPFSRMDLAFARQLVALRIAFPGGPSSVALGEASQSIVLPDDDAVSITTVRANASRISYRLEGTSIHATGIWDKSTQTPLADSYSLMGWTTPDNRQFRALKQARAAPAQ